ncbi:DUF4328 domain-containing protein [Microtetraspora fusca]|uniref:DUF4328 domain-containing protein n=1 Tax=Microtetraspora fusca TaxID=1997 RepID=UPI00082B46F5|nr:DUF4328 domain-containing protein [Microtetraspora fusca]
MNASASWVPARSLRPIRGLAASTVTLIALSALASACLSTAHLITGEPPAARTVHVAGLYALVQAPAGIAFVCWLLRARANAYAISPEAFHRYAALFMVAGWLLPVVQLFVPKGIVDDIWAASQPAEGPRGFLGDLRDARRPALVWAWWLAYLAMNAAWAAAVRTVPGTASPAVSPAVLVSAALAAHAALSLLAGALAVGVVTRITAFQGRAHGRRPQPAG